MPIPQTLIRSSHALSIKAGGHVVGMIQGWNPSQSRTITPAYEMKSDTSGKVQENVPGNESGLTIQVNRYDLFKSKMEEVWGDSSLASLRMIGNQLTPFSVTEIWKLPGNTPDESNEYTGCWFSQLGRNMQATGDRIVQVNATLNYVSIKKTS